MTRTPELHSGWIAHDTIIQILILRAVGIIEGKMAVLLRIRSRQLSYYISRYIHLGWMVYNRYYRIIDYLYFLSNSLEIPRVEIQDMIIVSFAYGLDNATIFQHLQESLNTIPKDKQPVMPLYTVPLFKHDHFHLLWYGKIPVIALS